VKKIPAPFDFFKTISIFKVDFPEVPNQQNDNLILLRFLYGNEAIALHSIKYIFKKKGIDKNIYKPFNKSEGLHPMY
jgi:hypothetical protein